jgi:hypothetical protein
MRWTVAGGDVSLGPVAAIAADGLPFACVPAGTKNRFALDLGIDRHDLIGALDALNRRDRASDRRRRCERPQFLNNVSLSIYADAVRRPACPDAKVRTLLETPVDRHPHTLKGVIRPRSLTPLVTSSVGPGSRSAPGAARPVGERRDSMSVQVPVFRDPDDGDHERGSRRGGSAPTERRIERSVSRSVTHLGYGDPIRRR